MVGTENYYNGTTLKDILFALVAFNFATGSRYCVRFKFLIILMLLLYLNQPVQSVRLVPRY